METAKSLITQVGGHPGISMTEDGSLVIKPALPSEVAFYQLLATDPRLEGLIPYVPAFYGTLKLEGRVDNEAAGLDLNAIKPVEGVPEDECAFRQFCGVWTMLLTSSGATALCSATFRTLS